MVPQILLNFNTAQFLSSMVITMHTIRTFSSKASHTSTGPAVCPSQIQPDRPRLTYDISQLSTIPRFTVHTIVHNHSPHQSTLQSTSHNMPYIVHNTGTAHSTSPQSMLQSPQHSPHESTPQSTPQVHSLATVIAVYGATWYDTTQNGMTLEIQTKSTT